MSIAGLDHAALPTAHPEEMLAFYRRLGFDAPDAETWRATKKPFFSVHFGSQKINFHASPLWSHPEFTLRGPAAQPGCGDLCFVWDGDLASLERRLHEAGAEVVEGPVRREGGRGEGTSLYVRDPDRNLLEFIVYP